MDECYAEIIDGTWDTSMCGCEDCVDVDCDAIEAGYESGDITYGGGHGRPLPPRHGVRTVTACAQCAWRQDEHDQPGYGLSPNTYGFMSDEE